VYVQLLLPYRLYFHVHIHLCDFTHHNRQSVNIINMSPKHDTVSTLLGEATPQHLKRGSSWRKSDIAYLEYVYGA
jgi:hypothetical protein